MMARWSVKMMHNLGRMLAVSMLSWWVQLPVCCEAVDPLVPILATTQVAPALLWVSSWVAYLATSGSDKEHR